MLTSALLGCTRRRLWRKVWVAFERVEFEEPFRLFLEVICHVGSWRYRCGAQRRGKGWRKHL